MDIDDENRDEFDDDNWKFLALVQEFVQPFCLAHQTEWKRIFQNRSTNCLICFILLPQQNVRSSSSMSMTTLYWLLCSNFADVLMMMMMNDGGYGSCWKPQSAVDAEQHRPPWLKTKTNLLLLLIFIVISTDRKKIDSMIDEKYRRCERFHSLFYSLFSLNRKDRRCSYVRSREGKSGQSAAVCDVC